MKIEPVASIVPCYTPSGKRVALNTRHQGLPIGTVLYSEAQMRQAMEACAAVCESRQTPGTGSVDILNGAADEILELTKEMFG